MGEVRRARPGARPLAPCQLTDQAQQHGGFATHYTPSAVGRGACALGPPPAVGRIAGAWLRQRPAGLPRSRRVARGALRVQRLSAAARCRHQRLRPWSLREISIS